MEIDWKGNIGTSDCCDICSKRMVWWVKLNNGQAARVADVTVVINPFPAKGGTHYCSHHVRLTQPGIKYDSERKAYADAVFAAGVWCGDMIARAQKVRFRNEVQRNGDNLH